MIELEFREILDRVYKERGFDFRQYKESSLTRRIERRLHATKAESYKDYIIRLDADPAEYDKLIDIFLINVTEFFRDKEAFDIIKNEALPDIIENNIKPKLKIWSAGCATGEEVYSIAIIADEILGNRRDGFGVSIYGTDIDRHSLAKAEEGIYKSVIVKDNIPSEILSKYFDINGSIGIKEFVKRNCFFVFHDLVSDKPFNEVDLVLCRNVAIYFERSLQEKIYMDFYNALNEGGYLFLGKAETLIGPARERFNVIDKRWKIYKKER